VIGKMMRWGARLPLFALVVGIAGMSTRRPD
jgi:hypothetical protein